MPIVPLAYASAERTLHASWNTLQFPRIPCLAISLSTLLLLDLLHDAALSKTYYARSYANEVLLAATILALFAPPLIQRRGLLPFTFSLSALVLLLVPGLLPIDHTSPFSRHILHASILGTSCFIISCLTRGPGIPFRETLLRSACLASFLAVITLLSLDQSRMLDTPYYEGAMLVNPIYRYFPYFLLVTLFWSLIRLTRPTSLAPAARSSRLRHTPLIALTIGILAAALPLRRAWLVTAIPYSHQVPACTAIRYLDGATLSPSERRYLLLRLDSQPAFLSHMGCIGRILSWQTEFLDDLPQTPSMLSELAAIHQAHPSPRLAEAINLRLGQKPHFSIDELEALYSRPVPSAP